MRIPALAAIVVFGLSACGGGASETLISVQVVDFAGSTLGAVPVIAEQRSIAQAGESVEILDTITTSTDKDGLAYLKVKAAKDYRVSVELELPGDPGCSYKATSWVSSANPDVVITLDRKVCT